MNFSFPLSTICWNPFARLLGLGLVIQLGVCDAVVIKDVPYGPEPAIQKLDLHLPDSGLTGPTGLIVWIHGAGSGAGGKARRRAMCDLLAEAGYVCAELEYHPWTAHLVGDCDADRRNVADVKFAIRFLAQNSARYHLDPTRIALVGGSAGGYLALMAGYTENESEFSLPGSPADGPPHVRAIVDLSGPCDWLDDPKYKTTVSHLSESDANQLRRVEPITYVSKNVPATLIVHGKEDDSVNYFESECLDRVLGKVGAEHELVLMTGVGHSFDLLSQESGPLPIDLKAKVLSFLRVRLGKSS